MKSIGVGILGGTGYGAGELLRLLSAHPAVEVVSVVSSSKGGKLISDAHSHLAGVCTQHFDDSLNISKLNEFEHAVVFSALPHQTSAIEIKKILDSSSDIKIVDLSADFRLQDEARHQAHYPECPVLPETREKFCYGLTEVNREQIANSKYVANPGCLSSASILAVLPVLQDVASNQIVIDAKTGTSGAGKAAQDSMHHPRRDGNFTAYKMLEHRHEAEIVETLSTVSGLEIESAFVPHLIPTSRGIFVSAYCQLDSESSRDKILEKYQGFYKSSPFVRVSERVPDLSSVLGSNFCDISVAVRGRQLVAMSALDNLVKGMAGQAIQNMNLMCGLEEQSGIWLPALGPA